MYWKPLGGIGGNCDFEVVVQLCNLESTSLSIQSFALPVVYMQERQKSKADNR